MSEEKREDYLNSNGLVEGKIPKDQRFLDGLGVALLCIFVFLIAGAFAYACEVQPIDECMKEGHSFNYCYRLLNK